MKKKTFIIIMNELKHFYGDTWEKVKALGFDPEHDAFTHFADMVYEALEEEVDPDRLAEKDKYCAEAESFLFEWIFGDSDFNNLCPTAEDLWNYIQKSYSKSVSKE